MKYVHISAFVLLLGVGTAVDGTAQDRSGWWEWMAPVIETHNGRAQTGRRVVILNRDGHVWNGRRKDRDYRRRGDDDDDGERRRDRRYDDDDDDDDGYRKDRRHERRRNRRHEMRRERWEDIIFRSPRRTHGTVRGRVLEDILGAVIYRRLDDHRRNLGASGRMEGRWLRPNDRAYVLQVRAGNVPLAEFTDYDGDGRVDVVMVNR